MNLPFLGMIPAVVPAAGATAPRPAALRQPDGPVAEAYRVVRTNLLFSTVGEGGRALMVTSTNPGEGKTTTAANLAISLAANGARVLVVDADLRRPTLHQHFGISKTPGPLRRHRRQAADLGGDPEPARQGLARPALRLHAPEPRRAPRLAGHARDRAAR